MVVVSSAAYSGLLTVIDRRQTADGRRQTADGRRADWQPLSGSPLHYPAAWPITRLNVLSKDPPLPPSPIDRKRISTTVRLFVNSVTVPTCKSEISNNDNDRTITGHT